MKISVATQYVQQIEEIKRELAKKASDLEECVATCAQHVTTIEDLTQRLAAAAQSRMDAEEAILRCDPWYSSFYFLAISKFTAI